MGNGVGKIVGVIAGAAISCIPGVGQVAGALIFLGTTAAGSGVDALVENGKQNDAADAAAETARQEAAKKVEAARVKARKELEDNQRTANENAAAAEIQVENQRLAAIREREQQEEIARIAQLQITLLENALAACAGDTTQLPGILNRMDDEHFALYVQRAYAACESADALEACRIAIEHEEMRRAVVNGWERDLNQAADNNPAQPAGTRPTL